MLIVEDGTVVPGANSYVSVDTFKAFAASRGVPIAASTVQCESMLLEGMDWLEAKWDCWPGSRKSEVQSLQWPRTKVTLYGAPFSDELVPDAMRKAQMQLGMEVYKGVRLFPNVQGGFITRQTVGPITRMFDPKLGGRDVPRLTAVEATLAPLYRVGGCSAGRLRTVRI